MTETISFAWAIHFLMKVEIYNYKCENEVTFHDIKTCIHHIDVI